MAWKNLSNSLVRLSRGRYFLLIPWQTVERVFSGCGMEEEWRRASYKVMAVFYGVPRSDYVYVALYPRPPVASVMPRDCVAGRWRSAVVKADGTVVLDKRNTLEIQADGLHSMRQFEPGDRLTSQYQSGSNVIRIRMPRRPTQAWDWTRDGDFWL